MICPKCKQKTNHVINTKFFDEFNYLERERECRHPNCFNKFITYEQISPDNKRIPKLKIPEVKIRKIEARTLWQEHRFLNYASMLIGNVFAVLLDYLKENNLINDSSSSGNIEFYVSDFPQKFDALGSRFFGRKLIDVTHISFV